MDMHQPTGASAIPVMRPRSGAPKVIGILNIVFGTALGLGGVCCGLYVMMLSALSPVIGAQQTQVFQQIKDGQAAQRAAQVRQLEEQEEAAQTEEEKQSIRDQRTTLQSTPIPTMPNIDMSKMYGMNDPRVIVYWLVDMLSGVLLNVLLIISGLGLVAMREWGRKMAITIAAIKIVRLLLLQAFSMLVIVPIVTKQMTEAMEQMMSQMQPGPGGAPPPAMGPQLGTVYGTMMTLSAVCMLIFGSIYPGIVLWLLTRPEAKLSGQQLESPK
jgi:hypothetical protein